MTRIIAIANQKGGVGKTTTAINLSAALAHFGKDVLLIDFDAQGNSGRGLGIDVTSLRETVYDAVISHADVNTLIKPTSVDKLSILPSNLKLASLDSYLVAQGSQNPFFLLKDTLKKIKTVYDYIIIDCPPSLGLLNVNALVASNEVIVPVQCEYFAMEAVAAILSSITKVQNDYNPELKIEGFLLTMYDPRTSLDTEVAMSLGVVALVGAPSSGKSTLFNRIVGERKSIVEETPGITRDRLYSRANWLTKDFTIIDTGGVQIKNVPFQTEIRAQVEIAIEEADLIIFVVDGNKGLTGDDRMVKCLWTSIF